MMDLNEDLEIEEAIIKILLARDPDKSICPSEVVRHLYPQNWRDKMESVRKIAAALAHENIIVITQKDKQVDVNTRGPIRLRLKP